MTKYAFLKVFILIVIVGAILKYVIGGSIFDLIGHIIMFLGCLNATKSIRSDKEGNFNLFVSILILVLLFVGVQILMLQVFNNLLDITPLLH